MKLVCGVGVNDKTFPAKVGGKLTREYALWSNMLNRCYSSSYHKLRPTYTGCSMSEAFKHFSYFHRWVNSQIGFQSMEGGGAWALDKDLLVKGNKLYSEDTCVFVPQSINLLLIKRDADRGVSPIGVCWSEKHGCYRASCRVGGLKQHIGLYQTAEAAFSAYKLVKENEIKKRAKDYHHLLDQRVFEALLKYEVEIDD
jgi:hypothetical protein